MTFTVACNCQGFFARRPATGSIAPKLRRLARGSLMAAVLMLGSAVVVTSWMPTSMQPVAQQTELYLKPAESDVGTRQDLSDSISPSTVLGGSIR
jgi:hypothetical protein